MIQWSTDKTQMLPSGFKEHLDPISTVQHYEKGSVLFMDGDLSKGFYLIQSGRVKISKTTPEGKELTLYICQQGELIGELALFQPNITHTTTAEVLEEVTISVITQRSLEELMMKNGKVAVEFMKWMGVMYRRNQSKFRDLILHGKHGALYSTLLRMCNSYGKKVENGILIDLPLTNQELAKFIATPRESVNRMLSELRKENIITVDNGYITVHDQDFLKRYIDCDNCPPDICSI